MSKQSLLVRCLMLPNSTSPYISINEVAKGSEEVLVLIPNGTPEQINAFSLQVYRVQAAIKAGLAWRHFWIDDFKYPKFTVMNPTTEEWSTPGGVVEQAIAKADIVLSLVNENTWMVVKHPASKDDTPHYLQFDEIQIEDIFNEHVTDVWLYIDHHQTDTNRCENLYQILVNHLMEMGLGNINCNLMSGHPTVEFTNSQEVILMLSTVGVFVDKARGTRHAQKLIPIKELIGPAYKESPLSSLALKPIPTQTTDLTAPIKLNDGSNLSITLEKVIEDLRRADKLNYVGATLQLTLEETRDLLKILESYVTLKKVTYNASWDAENRLLAERNAGHEQGEG